MCRGPLPDDIETLRPTFALRDAALRYGDRPVPPPLVGVVAAVGAAGAAHALAAPPRAAPEAAIAPLHVLMEV